LKDASANLPAPKLEFELDVMEDVDINMEEADKEEEKRVVAKIGKDRAKEDRDEFEHLWRVVEKIMMV
jgi:hypothetical protein